MEKNSFLVYVLDYSAFFLLCQAGLGELRIDLRAL